MPLKLPDSYVLFHGTTFSNFQAILRDGLKAPGFLSSDESIARYYAEAAGDEAPNQPKSPDGVIGVVSEFSGVPSAWLRHDRAAMDEPVGSDAYTGRQMDARASRALSYFKRRYPSSYDRQTKTLSVPESAFQVSLNAVFSVKCAEMLPASLITRFRYVYADKGSDWQGHQLTS